MGVTVDWRAYTLEALLDMRLRIAKAAALRAQFGVALDWRRFNWEQLDGMTRALAGQEAARVAPEARAEELVTPTFAPLPARRDVVGDPDAVLSPTFAARRPPPTVVGDPDAVLTPTFAARTRWPRGGQGPDGLITPTFAPSRQAPASSSSRFRRAPDAGLLGPSPSGRAVADVHGAGAGVPPASAISGASATRSPSGVASSTWPPATTIPSKLLAAAP